MRAGHREMTMAAWPGPVVPECFRGRGVAGIVCPATGVII
jgi:hypothetical protein